MASIKSEEGTSRAAMAWISSSVIVLSPFSVAYDFHVEKRAHRKISYNY